MYEKIVERLRLLPSAAAFFGYTVPKDNPVVELYLEAADAIEELIRQRDRAYCRLCEWCGVCPVDRRNLEDCEIAAIYPEPPKEEA